MGVRVSGSGLLLLNVVIHRATCEHLEFPEIGGVDGGALSVSVLGDTVQPVRPMAPQKCGEKLCTCFLRQNFKDERAYKS